MSGIPPPPPLPPGLGPPPPPPPPGSDFRALTVPTLPQINIPRPRSKMKTLQWQKIPVNNVIGKSNIWTIIGRLENKYEMDYDKMDELFSLNHDTGPKRSSQDTDGVPDHKKKRENMEINILDGKRSLNVNIFLKQFRMEHKEIVQLLQEGKCEKLGAERLRSLLKLLPSQEEIDAIKAFNGDLDKLGNAEKFFICLMKLPNYRMRTEGLLIMEEFNVNMEWIRPSIEAVIQAAKDIQDSQSLKELIYLILISGNYLNSGNYAGNAAGFKLSSLLKLTEIRANKPKMNLMHYVAQEAEVKNPKLLRFPDEMKCLKEAAQVSIEALTTDISNIASKVRAITEQIVVAGADFQQQMAFFLKEANVEVDELEEDLNDIEIIRQELATFFCEDIKTFKLEECFTILQTFCERLKKATEENIQRRIQIVKAEKRRQSKESKVHRNTTEDITDHSDQSFGHNIKEEEACTVDMLLADVRSGFASRKFNDGNFSVTKVTKVNLSPTDQNTVTRNVAGDATDGDGLFSRGGYGRVSQQKVRGDSSLNSPLDGSSPTPDSLAQKRSRRSYATDDDDSLMEFLMESAEALTAVPAKPKSDFDHYANLRKRRLERKTKQTALKVTHIERERTPSPPEIKSPSIPTSAVDIRVRHDKDVAPSNSTQDRCKSEIQSNSKGSVTLRRSRSWLDKPSVEKANVDDIDESDALIRRLKQRLSKKSGSYTPPIAEEGSDEATMRTNFNYSIQDNTPLTRKGSRFSSDKTESENNTPLETKIEKNTVLNDSATSSQTKNRGKTQDRLSNRFSSSLNNAELDKVLQKTESSAAVPKHSKDDCDLAPNVMVSMRKRISSGMGTDIDGVLKTIEVSGRQIDTVGVTGPIKRTPDPVPNQIQSHPQIAIVTNVTASNIPTTPIIEQDLKAKRDKRKKRSTLSADDVKAAMKISTSPKNTESVHKVNSSLKAKTPPTQRRMRSNSDKTDSEKIPDDGSNNIELNKAAKLAAARKKFRGARFGVTGTYDVNTSSRARSNVESDSVEKALKEIASQSNMSRSKSYDEHVAKIALAGEDDFVSNGIKRMNSGSAPDTSSEKCAVLRNSLSRLSMDGRRNGLYIPSDDSDTELKPEDVGTRRSSKSDSTKSFSQLSLKSVNTSTETLPAESESLAEQNIKNIDSVPYNNNHINPSVVNNAHSKASYPSDIQVSSKAIPKENFKLNRSYSLMERHKNIEEDNESPLAAVAKWRLKRAQQRRSAYDNVNESNVPVDSVNNITHKYVHNTKSEENDLKTESGSRSSYASSNDRDEGFETASGTMSQRTSMNSNLEVEMYGTPTLSGRAESYKSKGVAENQSRKKPVINSLQENNSVISGLSVEEDRKERTESWTEQIVRVNTLHADSSSNTNGEFCNTFSPDSGHSTSKEDIWNDDAALPSSKSSKSTSVAKQKVISSPAKIMTTDESVKGVKPKSVPSYMLPTSSSAKKPVQSRISSNLSTDTATSTTAFTRDTPNRTSTRDQKSSSAFKRDTVRASMRAETATAAFERGTIARTSIRGPRSSIGSAKTLLSPTDPGRSRSDSNASILSVASGISNISATPSNVSESTRRRLAPTSNTRSPIHGRPTTPSSQPTVPASRSTTLSPRAITPASHSNASSVTASGGFTRTQSMRVTSGRSSLGNDIKNSTPISTVAGRRSITPLSDKGPSTTPILPERPQSTTPLSSENKITRRSSFMAPTASSRAKVDEQTPVAPPRTKSLHRASNESSFTRSASLRMPKNISGRESPATELIHHKPEHHQSLSTVAEQVGDEEKEKDVTKKSPSLFNRTGVSKSKVSPIAAKSTGTKSVTKK